MTPELPAPADVLRAPGPWTHRDVSAGGSRFHIAEMGTGPVIVFLHGFPMLWWTWRRQLPLIADAGYRAVAMDLRGYGGSDHTPHGYDPFTLAADVGAVIRTLGADDAVVVGHGLGGLIAWTLGAVHPDLIRGISVISAPHPLRLRHAAWTSGAQFSRLRFALSMQPPLLPERALTRNHAVLVEHMLRRRTGVAHWPSDEECAAYRTAMLTPVTAYCASEFYRWAIRSIPRRDGRRYAAAMGEPVLAPVLQIHGTRDPVILTSSVDGSAAYVTGKYELVDLDCGHYPQEELPAQTTAALLDWVARI